VTVSFTLRQVFDQSFIFRMQRFLILQSLNSYLLTSVGAPSATALLQHGIQLKIVPPCTVSSTTSGLTSWPNSF